MRSLTQPIRKTDILPESRGGTCRIREASFEWSAGRIVGPETRFEELGPALSPSVEEQIDRKPLAIDRG
jgi:hypothetical protein